MENNKIRGVVSSLALVASLGGCGKTESCCGEVSSNIFQILDTNKTEEIPKDTNKTKENPKVMFTINECGSCYPDTYDVNVSDKIFLLKDFVHSFEDKNKSVNVNNITESKGIIFTNIDGEEIKSNEIENPNEIIISIIGEEALLKVDGKSFKIVVPEKKEEEGKNNRGNSNILPTLVTDLDGAYVNPDGAYVDLNTTYENVTTEYVPLKPTSDMNGSTSPLPTLVTLDENVTTTTAVPNTPYIGPLEENPIKFGK